jgi:hypothetical protein
MRKYALAHQRASGNTVRLVRLGVFAWVVRPIGGAQQTPMSDVDAHELPGLDHLALRHVEVVKRHLADRGFGRPAGPVCQRLPV